MDLPTGISGKGAYGAQYLAPLSPDTDGAGQGIIEDIGRDGLEEIVQNKDEKGEDYIISEFQGIPMYWDYTRFDLASENLVLKEKARYLRALYEIPFEDDFEPDFSE